MVQQPPLRAPMPWSAALICSDRCSNGMFGVASLRARGGLSYLMQEFLVNSERCDCYEVESEKLLCVKLYISLVTVSNHLHQHHITNVKMRDLSSGGSFG